MNESSESAIAGGKETRIKALVQRFRVCWEEHPEQVLVKKEIRKIGFLLELYGTTEPGSEQASANRRPTQEVALALKEIAEWILPREERPSRHEVDADSQSLTYSRERGDRPDVRVSIRILHRNNWDQPIDDCEVRCLKEMEQTLSELGACKGAWRSRHTQKIGPMNGIEPLGAPREGKGS